MLLGIVFVVWFMLMAGLLGLFVYIEWHIYPWQCKICGLPEYPYGCKTHVDPLSDIELVLGTLWPHLPKHVLEYDKWGIHSPSMSERRILIYRDHSVAGYIYLREMVLTIYWDKILSMAHNFVDAQQMSWNVADPNSIMQIVNKIKEVINAH